MSTKPLKGSFAHSDRVRCDRAKSNLEAFARILDAIGFEDDIERFGDGPACAAAWVDLTTRERARLAKLVEHQNDLFPGEGEALNRIAIFSFQRARRNCGVRSTVTKRRHFGLRKKAALLLKAEFARTKRVPNPHRPGCYHFIIEALKALGVDRPHGFNSLRAKVEKLMGVERWRIFAHRETAKHQPKLVDDVEVDANARLHCNCRVLQRVNDYGLKLLQVGREIMGTRGCVLDIVKRRGRIMYCLNTNSDTPKRFLMGRQRRPCAPASITVEGAARR